mmetsp:Transcript_90960/g.262182  ORF Transcript_90960/g.262182 Transcript_90960/m.262182 type:complete len:225 (-) Transcript_90960:11-685(-)
MVRPAPSASLMASESSWKPRRLMALSKRLTMAFLLPISELDLPLASSSSIIASTGSISRESSMASSASRTAFRRSSSSLESTALARASRARRLATARSPASRASSSSALLRPAESPNAKARSTSCGSVASRSTASAKVASAVLWSPVGGCLPPPGARGLPLPCWMSELAWPFGPFGGRPAGCMPAKGCCRKAASPSPDALPSPHTQLAVSPIAWERRGGEGSPA